MRVDRVSYQKIFPTGMAYLNHKIGVEIQVEENDDWQEAFELAKRMVEQWNKESNPSMGLAMEYFKETPLPDIDRKKEDTIDAINNATTPHELDLLMGDIAKHQLVPQYLEKKKSLK